MRIQIEPESETLGQGRSAAYIRVLVADDHPVIREGLAAVIGRHPGMEVIAEARDGLEALEMFDRHVPNVVLMDLRMPRMDGIEATSALRMKHPRARILLLTTFGAEEEIYRGIRAGANGYVLKDATGAELLAAIETIYRGGAILPPTVAERLARRISSAELTSREVEVLKCMAAGRSNQGIAAELFVSEGTVKSHISSILAKLSAHDRTHAVTIAIRRGLLYVDE